MSRLSPNETIGHFLLLEKLGAGGLGEVWKARDVTLTRMVALKFVSSGGRELLKEARAASALNHPNIVTVFEVGESLQGVYMAMEVVDGETLRARMERGEMARSEIADIAMQVAEGLAVAHAAGIVHRDLKPENIMLRRDGYVKILDFGLAKRLPWAQSDGGGASIEAATASVGTVSGHLAGTFAYMSPEQARGRELDAPSDDFSYGIILHEMATGKHPFRGATVLDTLHNIVSSEVPDASHPLAAVVRRALMKDPLQRYADARGICDVLQAVSASSAAAIPLTPPVSPAPAKDTPKSNVVPTSRWMQATGVLLSTALLAMAFVPDLKIATGEAAGAPKVSSVAVLSFPAPAGDDVLASFSQDLSEDLSSLLSKSGLQVSSQSAVQALGPLIAAQEAAQKLSVNAVFAGGIRLSGKQMKVRVELVDAKNGFQLWSDTLTCDRDEASASEQRIAQEILSRVRAAIAAKE